ncbi:hypothetical protein AURDEDRAFT_110221 [Auricularia subglabra TFB-10046 SS5]|nr:hypothetical protein AURDEDRAFT_110221 [Auricularia subglabra TFB-10046 SS5]
MSGYALRDTRQRQQMGQPAWTTRYGGDDIKLPSSSLVMPHHPTIEFTRDFDDPSSGASDFVKRLYRLLEDNTYPGIIGWGPGGDTFVVADMNEFTRHVMPKMFKHSNFASFVRQLNKYDFHKVKSANPEETKVHGEQSWTFKHPHFQSKNLDGLENVKRKVPPKKSSSTAASAAPKRSTSPPAVDEALAQKIDSLSRSQDDLRAVVERLDHNYQTVLRELVAVQRSVAQQESMMQTLMHQLIQQQVPSEYKPCNGDGPFSANMLPQPPPLTMPTPPATSSDNSPFPAVDMSMLTSPDANMYSPPQPSAPVETPNDAQVGSYKPRWSVPPRILVVDDDAVSRTVSSRFLQNTGCSFDLATDGYAAVDKMNLAKYDLVLMDIVMPNLDGLSATSIIRQFDPLTPIISMTGNSTPDDVVNYFSHGMNDVLSKPFTLDNMISILEKHLMHLKAAWDLQRPGEQQQQQTQQQQQQQYLAMAPQQMHSLLIAKRPRDDEDEERDNKRGRLDLVE